MALKTISLAVLCFLASCTAEHSCNEVQCKLLPVGKDLTSEFQLKASEKGVRMVYLNLEIGNDSYRPLDLQDEFLPETWVWARSISEPMLSLPYDYDILSLGLFNLQVRSMNIRVKDHPSGCLAGLNSSCQNMVVGRALLANVTQDSSSEHLPNTEVVCVAMIETNDQDIDDDAAAAANYSFIYPLQIQFEYHCCRLNATNRLRCDMPAVKKRDLDIPGWLNIVAVIISSILIYYWPALPLALPDCVFNFQYECFKEERLTRDQQTNTSQVELTTSHASDRCERMPEVNNQTEEEHTQLDAEQTEQIPVDDASPMSYSTLLRGCLQRLPDLRVSFNIKLAVMMFCILPFFLYLKMAIYLTLKRKYLHERLMKSPSGNFSIQYGTWLIPVVMSLWASISFLIILVLRPKDFLINLKKSCFICAAAVKFSELHGSSYNFSRENLHQHVGHEMLVHMKLLQQLLFLWGFLFRRPRNNGLNILQKLFSYPLMNGKVSRPRQALHVLWVLILIVVGAAVFPVIFLILYLSVLLFVLFFCSPVYVIFRHYYVNMSLFVLKRRALENNDQKLRITMLSKLFVCAICIFIAFFFFYGIISAILILSCIFIVKILGFTIMGLALNAEIVSPYVAFLLVVVANVYLCYANLQNRYMEIKEFISKYWLQEVSIKLVSDVNEVSEESDVSKVSYSKSDQDTIPTKLFWFVIDKLFPIETEICLMVRNMALIVIFLVIALSSIILFGNTYNISAVNTTIGIFVSGVIPALFFRGSKKGKYFSGWEQIKIKREIEKEVKQFVQETGGSDIGGESIQRRSQSGRDIVVNL